MRGLHERGAPARGPQSAFEDRPGAGACDTRNDRTPATAPQAQRAGPIRAKGRHDMTNEHERVFPDGYDLTETLHIERR